MIKCDLYSSLVNAVHNQTQEVLLDRMAMSSNLAEVWDFFRTTKKSLLRLPSLQAVAPCGICVVLCMSKPFPS